MWGQPCSADLPVPCCCCCGGCWCSPAALLASNAAACTLGLWDGLRGLPIAATAAAVGDSSPAWLGLSGLLLLYGLRISPSGLAPALVLGA